MVAFLWRSAITLLVLRRQCYRSHNGPCIRTLVRYFGFRAVSCLYFFRFSRATLEGFSMVEGLLGGAGNHGNEDSGHVL